MKIETFFFDGITTAIVGVVICFVINIVSVTCFERQKKYIEKLIVFIISVFCIFTIHFFKGLYGLRFFSSVLYLLLVVCNVVYLCMDIIKCAKDLNERSEKSKSDLQIKESEMSQMLSQIKPHFIYNTLNTIQYLCRIDPELAAETIADFSQYLRMNLSISDRKQIVPFSVELEHVKSYLKIETLRFKHKLKVRYEIETEEFNVPVLSVQPLVENAVKHGMTNRMNGITIILSVYKENDNFIINIKDDGIGFNVEETDGKHESVGVNNVRIRLETLFNGRLLIKSREGVGTEVRMIIPSNNREGEIYEGCVY